MLLDYLAAYPDAKIRYTVSEIILHFDSDAAYVVAPNTRSREAGYFYYENPYTKSTMPNTILNRPIHTKYKLLNI